MAESIKKFGFNQPIVIDKNNVIIVGHARYEASKLLGLKDVPVLQVDLTDEEAKAYRLADNKLNESDWDMDLVIEELKGLNDELIDLTGFDKDLIIKPDKDDDVIPKLPKESKAKRGDIYQLGKHRLMCGDATKIEDVEKLMDNEKAQMCFTDPPYNINYTGGMVKKKKTKKILNDNMKSEQFYFFLLEINKRIIENTIGEYIYV